jgi:tRNA uridine 5-carboxymethylaminomethyl modification enzyme
MAGLQRARDLVQRLSLTPNEARRHDLMVNLDGARRTAFELLAYPDIDMARLVRIWPELGGIDPYAGSQIEIEATYSVYLERQQTDIASLERDEAIAIPVDADFSRLAGLSNEIREKLGRVRPATLGQAARIDGMTPAALALMLAEIKRRGGRRAA